MTITGKSYTLRLNEAEAEEVNAFLSENTISGDNFKNTFLAIIRKEYKSETTVNECLPNDFKDQVCLELEIPTENKELDQWNDSFVMAQIMDALQHPKTVEVNKELLPDEYLIKLSDNELTVLNEISNNRVGYAAKYRKQHTKEEPIPLLKKMAFNRATLFNWHGEFYTGKK